MTRVGIMQGRLLPPVDGRIQRFPRDEWRQEFPLAAQAGLSSLEWIYEVFGADDNPLGTDSGIAEMQRLAGEHDVVVRSICADFFMDRPLLRAEGATLAELLDRLRWLLERGSKLGADRVILPFVDASRIQDARDAEKLPAMLSAVLPAAQKAGVELHLETALAPEPFAALLAHLPHPLIKANYDSGNSASLGHDSAEEWAAYGGRIGSVHIKDRVRGGGTVPLGQGSVDFDAFFRAMKQARYDREFILQVARAEPGHEVAWARENLAFVRERAGASLPS